MHNFIFSIKIQANTFLITKTPCWVSGAELQIC